MRPVSSRLIALASCLAASLLTAGCSVSEDESNLRVIELIESIAPTDAYLDDKKYTSGAGFQTVGAFTKTPVGEQTLQLRSADGTGTLLTETVNLVEQEYSAAIVAGTATNPALYLIDDNPPRPGSGRSRLKVINTVFQGPTYDAFVTAGNVDINSASPIIANTASGSTSETADFNAGTYRVRITDSASREVIYDSGETASVNFASARTSTLVVYNGASASLVNAVILTGSTSDSIATSASTLARARLANAADLTESINLSDGTDVLLAGVQPGAASTYLTITASTTSFGLSDNGSPATNYGNVNLTLTPGEDHTVLASGSAPNLGLTLLKDDNRAPRAGFAYIRAINGVSGGGNADVFVRSRGDFSGIAFNTASATYGEYSPATGTSFAAIFANGAQLFDLGAANVDADRVYSLLMHGAVGAPAATLLTDR